MKITLEEWEETYSPLQDKEGCEITYETYGEFKEELLEDLKIISTEHKTKPHQHVWTRVDGDKGNLILLNGWHMVNRLDYMITVNPWGDGSENDSDVYIEVKYEGN